MGIATVAVAPRPTARRRTSALADRPSHRPAAAGRESYLREDLIIAAALATGAEAVHPGYGFLAENAAFAARVRARRGWCSSARPPEVIASMGDKTAARPLMAAAGVPVVPGRRCRRPARRRPRRRRGGRGGRGGLPGAGQGRGRRRRQGHAPRREPARTRWRPSKPRAREASGAFGDGTVYLERCLERPRHVEIQIFADSARPRRAPGRARVLDPAAPPEDRRGDALARPWTRRCAARMGDAAVAAAPRRRLRRRRHRGVPARPATARSTSWR